MRGAPKTRCVYCGYPGAKLRGGAWTCHACRDLPAYERAADAEIELLITAWYEGTGSKSAVGSIPPLGTLGPLEATRDGASDEAERRPTIGNAIG